MGYKPVNQMGVYEFVIYEQNRIACDCKPECISIVNECH